MNPVAFEGMNKTLTAPASGDCASVGELPVLTDGTQCVSCWALSWRERWAVLRYGKLWLSVLGGVTQPPVSLSASSMLEPAQSSLSLSLAHAYVFISGDTLIVDGRQYLVLERVGATGLAVRPLTWLEQQCVGIRHWQAVRGAACWFARLRFRLTSAVCLPEQVPQAAAKRDRFMNFWS